MIRRATLADLDGLKAAALAAYAPYAAQGFAPPAGTETLAQNIADHHVWVAEDRGFVLGGIVLMMQNGTAHIADIAVHPIGKGQGLGRQLIDTATAAANDAGCANIALTTGKNMTDTQAFYARLGWIETARDGDDITFALDLNERTIP